MKAAEIKSDLRTALTRMTRAKLAGMFDAGRLTSAWRTLHNYTNNADACMAMRYEAHKMGFTYSPGWWKKALYVHDNTTTGERAIMKHRALPISFVYYLAQLAPGVRRQILQDILDGKLLPPYRPPESPKPKPKEHPPAISPDDLPAFGADYERWADYIAGRLTYYLNEAERQDRLNRRRIFELATNRVNKIVK